MLISLLARCNLFLQSVQKSCGFMQGYVCVRQSPLVAPLWCPGVASQLKKIKALTDVRVQSHISEIRGVTITCRCEICIKLQHPKQPHPHFQFLCFANRLLASYLAYSLFFTGCVFIPCVEYAVENFVHEHKQPPLKRRRQESKLPGNKASETCDTCVISRKCWETARISRVTLAT